jgi:carboxymethylenebutenolidase
VQIQQTEVMISTADGQMPAFLYTPTAPNGKPAILLLMEAFGLTPHIQDVAARIAQEGYVVLAPDLYYRELPDNKFGYEQVEQARAMVNRLDIASVVVDIGTALATLKSHPDVYADKIGVMGFCLGGGLTLLAASNFSDQIAAAASFYGLYGISVEQWNELITKITAPVYLFLGEVDVFIPLDLVKQVESRFKELEKDYTLKVYPGANHGFFCHERSDYDPAAAEDSWQELKQFFRQHLQDSVST